MGPNRLQTEHGVRDHLTSGLTAAGRMAAAWLLLAMAWGSVGQADSVERCGDNMACLREAYSAHPVKSASYWRAFSELPIERRVLVASAKLLDYLNLDNRLNEFPNRPRAAHPPRQFIRDLKAAVGELPPSVLALVNSRLMGIYLVEDLGGTGYTDYVFDEQQQPVGAFVVLDAGVLTRSANAWASWKENTPFLADADYELRAAIENGSDDTLKQALQFIVLHEFGHVASVGRRIHPRWDAWDCVADPPGGYAFFQLSWEVGSGEGCQVISKFDESGFALRREVVYYFGARLALSASPEVYRQLELTNFPSLYAATSPADDFAETFATYVHTVLQGKPFEVGIDRLGERQVAFSVCGGSARCAKKQKMIEELLAGQD